MQVLIILCVFLYHETSHEQIFLTREDDYLGEFHLTNKIKIINR